MMERFSSLVTKSRPWPVIGRTIFFTSDKNRPTRDEIYFIDFWRENLSMYRIKGITNTKEWTLFTQRAKIGWRCVTHLLHPIFFKNTENAFCSTQISV